MYILKIQNRTNEIKNTWDGITRRQDTKEHRSSDLNNRSVENSN